MKINVLPDNLVSKIAAGEVVERPASVIKELTENAIDAGSKMISIRFDKGGCTLMEVSDNGEGMTVTDLACSIKRHATSKIKSFDDLVNISSLGFRGEALPSIGSVSKMTIITKTDTEDSANRLTVSGAKDIKIEPFSRARGTTVRVEDIFFNVPARKKFLKTENTEKRQVVSTVENLALSRPDIAFKLSSGEKTIFDLSSSTLKERIMKIIGKHNYGEMSQIDFSNPYVDVSGYISVPALSFSNNNRIYLFVNNRAVSSPVLFHGVRSGYESFIPRDRFPACCIFLSIRPELVDVNVHPAKKEVRFTNQHGIHEIISKVIKSTLEKISPVMDMGVADALESSPVGRQVNRKGATDMRQYKNRKASVFKSPGEQMEYLKNIDMKRVTKFTFKAPEEEGPPKNITGPLEKIIPYFQLNKKYIVGQDNEGLILVDQHTAWERINYEKLKRQYRDKNISVQQLLLPEIIELEPTQSDIIRENTKKMESYGFITEEFGPTTFKVTGVPSLSGKERDSNDIMRT
ncbi:DNA mismatch repair endonuclease MutL, partial [Elusimicrobiota bacterium]